MPAPRSWAPGVAHTLGGAASGSGYAGGAGGGASDLGVGGTSVGDGTDGSGRSLLSVDLRRLKAEDELKRIFGARVIHAVETEDGNRGGAGGAHANGRGGARGGGGGSSSTSRIKSTLVTPKVGTDSALHVIMRILNPCALS